MRVSFDFLNRPLKLEEERVNTLCIENQPTFRKIISAFLTEEPEIENVVFSKDFTPLSVKGNVCFIDSVFTLSYSNSVIKKLYESVEKYCLLELPDKTAFLKQQIVDFFECIVAAFDYDLDYSEDIELAGLFKTQNLRPLSDDADLSEKLLNFILFINNYTKVKCFVLLNLHLYFSPEELDLFYKDIINHHIKLLVLENTEFFEKSKFEKITVCDKDLCEIVENNKY